MRRIRDWWFVGLVVFAILIRLVFAFSWHELWWDSGVYVGMGKYIFSGGLSGLFEHIRPPLVPLMLGLLWKLGFDPVLFGRLIEILLMGGVVGLTYKLARFWFDKRVAILSSLFIALSPIFFHLSFHQYTEIPSVFLALLSLYLFIHGRLFSSGICLGLTFLAKFPAGIFLAAVLAVVVLHRKWVEAGKVSAGFSLAVLPYFVWSWAAYKSPLATLGAAKKTIDLALGCNVLRAKSWWYYFWVLPASESFLYLFAILGAYVVYKRWEHKQLLWLLSLLLPIAYLLQLGCKDYRYVTLFLPFIAMLASVGIVSLLNFVPRKSEAQVFKIVLAVSAVVMLSTALLFYVNNKQAPVAQEQEYFSWLSQNDVNGEVWVSNPSVAAFTDKKLEKVYYPIYDGELATTFEAYFDTHGREVGAVLLDNCGGGIICPPGDELCEQKTLELIDKLDARMSRVFDKRHGRCWYRVWARG